MSKRVLLSSIAAAFFMLPAVVPAVAQGYPTKTIRAITTTSAGGLSDIFMRVLGDVIRERWGQAVVVENRPGGAQNVGARACTEAPPDGYTICIINTEPVAYNQFLFKKMPFNPETGLQPVTNLFYLLQVLVVNSDLKVKNVDELIALSKVKAGTLSYLTASRPLALYMENLKKEKGADWVRVPFRGGGQATSAVLGGSSPIALIGLGNVATYIQGGQMTGLVMLNNIKSPQFPNIPTMKESGYSGPPSTTWYGLFMPAGAPKPIVDKWAKEVASIFQDKAFVQKHIIDRALVPAVNTPEEFAKQIIKDRALAKRVVEEAGLKPQ